MLSSQPYLVNILTTLSRIPNAPPRYPQEKRIRNILGLGEAEGVPVQLSYRPGEEADATQQSKFGPASSRKGNAQIDPEEREVLRKFNHLIKDILHEERSKRNAVTVQHA